MLCLRVTGGFGDHYYYYYYYYHDYYHYIFLVVYWTSYAVSKSHRRSEVEVREVLGFRV